MRTSSAVLFGLALLAGCSSEFTFSDSVNSVLYEIKPRAEFGDELSVPYVLGAEFSVFVEDNEHETDFKGWQIESTNPKVLAFRDKTYMIDQHVMGLDVAAVGQGETELILRDPGGDVRGTAWVEVLAPTRAKLYAAPIYALGNSDFRGETPRPRIVTGGTATFAIEYFNHDTRLQGATAIDVETSSGITAVVRRSELADNRNWLSIGVSEAGEHDLQLVMEKHKLPVQSVAVDGVRPAMIAGIEMIDADAATPDEVAGEWLVVAQAVAEDKQPIYGVDFEWSLPGIAGYDHPGDVFVYEHDMHEDFKRVTARAFGVESAISIRAAAGEPASSNDTSLTCSVGNSSGVPLWALALLVLGVPRRRRVRC